MELFLAFLNSSHGFFVFLAFAFGVGAFACAVPFIGYSCADQDDSEVKRVKPFIRKMLFKIFLPAFFFVGFVAHIPNVNDLWEVRIGLIKLELASPENIKKGADEIARIAQKLECKYLGCEEGEKK